MSIADDSLFFGTGLSWFGKLHNWSHRGTHILRLKPSLRHPSEAMRCMENSINIYERAFLLFQIISRMLVLSFKIIVARDRFETYLNVALKPVADEYYSCT